MSESIAEAQDSIVDEFSFFDDWQDKYAHLIDLGRELSPLAEDEKTENRIVRGCQSQVWLIPEQDGNKIIFRAESDALIVNGLIAVLLRIFSGRTADEILGASLDFLERIGLSSHLSMNRTNGLHSMIKTMRAHAESLK